MGVKPCKSLDFRDIVFNSAAEHDQVVQDLIAYLTKENYVGFNQTSLAVYSGIKQIKDFIFESDLNFL
jgi:hypothetical protein